MKKCKEWSRRLWMTVVTVGFAGLVSGAENNVWVGGSGSKEAPGDWNVVTNWMQGQAAPAKVPNTPGSSNFAPLVLEGTQKAPLYVKTTARIEGYTFNLLASYADITIQELNKLQTNTAITLRNESLLRLGYLPGGHFEFNHVDVGDGCTLELTTPDVNACGGTFAFDLNLNTSGKMTMQAWSLGGKSGTISFTLPLEAEVKGVRTRTLISWPSTATNNLSLSPGTVTPAASYEGACAVRTGLDLFAEEMDLSKVPVGYYCVKKDVDGYKVAWVVGTEEDNAEALSVSFDVPDGWTVKQKPDTAMPKFLLGTLELEQDTAFRQTLSERVANVANITGSDGAYNIYGINSSSAGDKSVLERDVWLKVSGGAHALIVGGKDNYWKDSHANAINGDLVTELSGSNVTAKSVIGGIYGCSDGGGSGTRVGLPFEGNTLVTIGAGSKVTGNIIGSSVPMHGLPFMHTGNTLVRVLALQDETNSEHTLNGSPAGYVVGASMRADSQNRETSANLTGNATVEVTLREGSGVFEKTILGGSFNNNANADSMYTILGDTSVIIDAPGVTFPRAIYAAGQGKNVTVQGKASVTLKGGSFTGALGVGINGATAKDSELLIDGGEAGIDLSQATVAEDFKALTLKSNLILGMNRLPLTALTVEGNRTVAITLTEDEKMARRVTLARATNIPEGLTITAEGLPVEETWALSVVSGSLCYVPVNDTQWVTPAEGSSWNDGLVGFETGKNVTFGANTTEEAVTLSETVKVGTLACSGTYRFEGLEYLTADAIVVAEEGVLVIGEGETLSDFKVLGGTGVVNGAISFEKGALQVSPEGPLTITGEISGTVALDLSAFTRDDSLVVPVLRAPEGVVFTLPEGYDDDSYIVHYTDGCYWVARALTPPLSLTVNSEDITWENGTWKDASSVSVALAQWDALPLTNRVASVTATADNAMLSLGVSRSVGSFTVASSEHTLTLGGAKLSPSSLTVAGKLAATSSTLAIPSGTTINGTLTYDVPSGSVAMLAMTGEGTFIKTGAGTLTLASGTEVAPKVVVKEGKLELPTGGSPNQIYRSLPDIVAEGSAKVDLSSATGSIADTSATITLRNGGILSFSNGNNYWSNERRIACNLRIENEGERYASIQGSYYGEYARISGSVSGHGQVVFEQGQGNPYAITGVLSDDGDGALRVRFADANNAITVSGTSTYTGGTEIASAVTASNAEAFGRGPLMIASDAKLTVASGKTLNVHGALSGQGTVSGAVQLVEGASLDASVGVLTVDTLSVAEGVTVPVTLPEALPEDGKLLAWMDGPETADAFTAENLPSTARLVAKEDGLYYEALTLADGVQETFKGLSEATQRALASAAFDAGATSIAAVSGENIAGAVQCFEGALTVTVDDAQAATLSVDYAFGIAAMKYNAAEGTFTVTAKVQGAAEAQTVTFASGTTVEVVVDGTDEALASASASASELTLPISAEKAATLLQAPTPIRVRVKK